MSTAQCASVSQANQSSVTGTTASTARNPVLEPGRRRIRRGKKKRVKREDDIAGLENLDDQERAVLNYHRRFQEGRAVAPLNSTQFIIADHGTETPQIAASPDHHLRYQFDSDDSSSGEGQSHSGSATCATTFRGASAVDTCFFEKDFAQVYNTCGREMLDDFSREKLIQRCVDLQQKVDDLEKSLRVSEDIRTSLERDLEELELRNR
eukprot:scpid89712/ scgid19376/ 